LCAFVYDPAVDDPREADERTTLLAFLEWQRATLARKCDGLTVERLRLRSTAPSRLSLMGLVRHMADGERWWFRMFFAGEDAPLRYSTDESPEGEFDVETADSEEAFRAWHEECRHSDAVIAAAALDDLGKGHRDDGRRIKLRWILVHMVEEYSRHNGHADLLRERIDGSVGYWTGND
jgi:uncharacterized damage-inducible protein DinB